MKKRISWLLLIAAACFIISADVGAGLYSSKSKSAKPVKSVKSVKQVKKAKPAKLNKPGKLLMSIDFEPNVPLKYKFVSERKVALDLDPSGKYSKSGKASGSEQQISEKLEMEIVYKPVEVDPYGYSIIEAQCTKAKVSRSSSTGKIQAKKDAVEYLAGKTFTLKITPTGKIADYSSLKAVIEELGQKAFSDPKRAGIKDSDMIMDFIAVQWNLWDAIASVKKPLKGVKTGEIWNSRLVAPMPFVSNTGRDVEYTLKDYNDVSAEIVSSYKLSSVLPGVPMPYSGSFQMRGTFGFLTGYKILSIEGTGSQIYDIAKGRIKSDVQQYQSKVKASIFGLGSENVEPNIIVNQTTAITLIE
ncbi:MAG: DUF6263 family protein [Phycisphaerae bacterium]|jgi:hypothetical protein